MGKEREGISSLGKEERNLILGKRGKEFHPWQKKEGVLFLGKEGRSFSLGKSHISSPRAPGATQTPRGAGLCGGANPRNSIPPGSLISEALGFRAPWKSPRKLPAPTWCRAPAGPARPGTGAALRSSSPRPGRWAAKKNRERVRASGEGGTNSTTKGSGQAHPFGKGECPVPWPLCSPGLPREGNKRAQSELGASALPNRPGRFPVPRITPRAPGMAPEA